MLQNFELMSIVQNEIITLPQLCTLEEYEVPAKILEVNKPRNFPAMPNQWQLLNILFWISTYVKTQLDIQYRILPAGSPV